MLVAYLTFLVDAKMSLALYLCPATHGFWLFVRLG